MALGVTCCGKQKNELDIGDKSDIKVSQNDVIMTIKEGTLTNKSATLVLTNYSDKNFQYGSPYEIEIKKDGEWHKINAELYFNMPVFQLSAKESKEIELDWKNAYIGNPKFYKGKDGKPFGAFALTENTLTSLTKNPRALYKIDDTEVDEWKLMLVSTTNNGVLGDIDYYKAINKLMKFVIDEKDNNILIRGLSLKELNEVLK